MHRQKQENIEAQCEIFDDTNFYVTQSPIIEDAYTEMVTLRIHHHDTGPFNLNKNDQHFHAGLTECV